MFTFSKTLKHNSKSVAQRVLPVHTELGDSPQLEAACRSLYFGYPIHYGTAVQED